MAAQILTDTADTTLTSTDLIGDLTNLYSKKAWSTTGVGYASGDSAGGSVTQLTSKSTGVTLNKLTGAVTMNNAALASGASVTFTLTNSTVTTSDVVVMNAAGNAAYDVRCLGCNAGSASVRVTNITGGSLSEAVQLNFVVLKGSLT